MRNLQLAARLVWFFPNASWGPVNGLPSLLYKIFYVAAERAKRRLRFKIREPRRENILVISVHSRPFTK